jgi:hypothetical protein
MFFKINFYLQIFLDTILFLTHSCVYVHVYFWVLVKNIFFLYFVLELKFISFVTRDFTHQQNVIVLHEKNV